MTSTRFAAVQWLSFIVVLGAILYLLSPILTPFVAAAILAYICNPPVQRLVRLKTPPTLAVLLVMLALIVASVLLLLILLPLLEKELGNLSARLPQFIDTLRIRLLPHLQQLLGVSPAWDGAWLKDFAVSHWQSAGKVLPWLSNSGSVLIELFANLVLIPVAMFYLLRDWSALVGQVDELIPRHSYDKVREIATEIDTVLAEFLRGQLSVMVLMSVYYVIVLWVVGLEYALPIGIVAGMLVFVPYLGMLVGLALATLAAVMQFTTLSDVVWVWAVFALGQLLEGMVVTPRLVGERVGLHPLVVIFALMAFGQLMGFFGILLALPLSAILLVALRHAKAWYLSSSMYRAL